MFKVVIVDDEPIIVEGLSRVLRWDDYDCQLAGTASNGREGLELIRRIQPDIIFTDIAMPGMDGLQMIAALRVEQPEAQITILTGYRDFDYAQTAIRLGVCRYLLKPSRLAELEEALTVMTEHLSRLPRETEKAAVKDEDQQDTGVPEATGTAGSFIVHNAMEYLNEHYAEKITLTELADKMYVSQWHLSKLLNKQMQKSFSDLLNEIRIREAKKLL